MKKYLLTLISIMVLTVFSIEANAQCTVVIGQPQQLTAVISGADGAYCLNAEVAFTVTVAGGTAPYTVTYGTTTLNAPPFAFTFQLTENTVIDLNDIVVTDAHECTVNITGSVLYTIEDVPPLLTCANVRIIEGCGTNAITGPSFSTTLALSTIEEFTNSINSGIATDDCGIAKVEYQDVMGTSTCPLIVTRTWTITDNSGNKATCIQTIEVDDTVSPAISDINLSNLTLSCDATDISEQITAWLNNHAGATATDECEVVNWSHDFTELIPGCGSTGTATVTFTASDACLNTSVVSANITVQDITVPTITTEASNAIVECDGEGNDAALSAWLANHGGATAIDNCGDIVWSYSPSILEISDDCGATGHVEVTFRATDECSLYSETTAIFTIIDVTKPVINNTNKLDLTIECADATMDTQIHDWLFNHAGATATDACSGDNINWTNNFTELSFSNGCGNGGEMTVTFTATDDCNNYETTTAKIIIRDQTPPSITTQASNKTVECNGLGNVNELNAWLGSNGGATATDLCGNVTWSNNASALSDLCGATGAVTVTFTATDECGNESATSATFTIVDTTPPTIYCPESILVQAVAGTTSTPVIVPLPQINETCGNYTYSNNFNNSQNASGTYPLGVTTVTYTVIDDCDNSNTCSFTVTVEQLPAFTTEYEDVQCFEGSDGWIKITPNSGTAPFRYSIDNGTNYTAPSSELYYQFNGLPAGTYKIRIKDANDYETPLCD